VGLPNDGEPGVWFGGCGPVAGRAVVYRASCRWVRCAVVGAVIRKGVVVGKTLATGEPWPICSKRGCGKHARFVIGESPQLLLAACDDDVAYSMRVNARTYNVGEVLVNVLYGLDGDDW
jgi:hypothetical protein